MPWGGALLARFDDHVRRHAGAYLFLAVVFSLGLGLGALAARLVPMGERQEIWQAAAPLSAFVPGHGAAGWRAVADDVGTVGLLWALGVTVIGWPAAVLVVGLRGVAIGFSCAFLAEQLGVPGLGLAAVGVVMPALFTVPAWLFVVVAGWAYGARAVRAGVRGDRTRLRRGEDPLGRLTACALGASLAGAAGAAVTVALATPASQAILTAWHVAG